MELNSHIVSPPDIKTCGICLAPLENDFEYGSLITPVNSEGENVDCKPVSVPRAITTLFQFPFNQVTGGRLDKSSHRIEDWLLDQSPFLTCGCCSKNARDFYSSFLQLQNLIHEASKLSNVLKEWTKLVIAGMKDVVDFEDEENVPGSLVPDCDTNQIGKDGIETGERNVDLSDGDHVFEPEAFEDDTPVPRRRTSSRIQQAKIKLEVTQFSDDDFGTIGHGEDNSDSLSEKETNQSFTPKTKKNNPNASRSSTFKHQCHCTICQQVFSSVPFLADHIGSDHDHVPDPNFQSDKMEGQGDPSITSFFGCGHCPKTFSNKNSLSMHFRYHSPARFPCSDCGKLFKKSDHLKRHLQNVHGRGRIRVKMDRKRRKAEIKPDNDADANNETFFIQKTKRNKIDAFTKEQAAIPNFFGKKKNDTSESLLDNVCSSEETAVSERNNENIEEENRILSPPPESPEVDDFSESNADEDEDYNPNPIRRTSSRSQTAKPLKVTRSSTNDEKDSDTESKAKSVKRKKRKLKTQNQKYLRKSSSISSEPQSRCTACQKTFSLVSLLIRHVNSDHGASIPRSRRASSKIELENVKVKDSADPIFTTFLGCAHCSKTFFKPDALRNHLVCHLAAKLPCSECGRFFKKSDHLKRHMLNIHGQKWIVDMKKMSGLKRVRPRCICSECGKSMWRSNLAAHMKIHRGDLPFQCGTCGKCFPIQSSLKAHLKSHSSDRPFCCSVCGNTYKTLCNLKEHEQIHQENKPKPFVCSFPDCGKSFRLKRTLVCHEAAHRPERNHACNICGAAFKVYLRASLRSHITSVHLKKAKADGLKTGEQKEKVVAESYVCPECGKVFQRKDNLRNHIRRMHEAVAEENSCQCEICGKTFRSPAFLKRHMPSHQTDRPFCCSVCGMAFKRGSHLKDHEKLHDKNAEKPFFCTFPNCDMAFRDRKGLRSHEQSHTATKDHACHICGTAFKRKDNLRQHIRNVHGKQVETTSANPLECIM